MTSLKKTGALASIGLALSIIVLYQNCGKGFVANQNVMEELAASSTGDQDSGSETQPSPDMPDTEIPPGKPPVVMDPPDKEDPTPSPAPIPTNPPPPLPPIGTTNPTGAPEITTGLAGRLELGSRDGMIAEIKVKDPTAVKNYEWLINGQKTVTTLPKITVRDLGQVDVSVMVIGKNGQSSSSRAIFSIAKFAVINGKLNYTLSSIYSFREIPDADVASLKLIGINTVADSSKVYSIGSSLVTLKAASPLSAKELSSNYLVVDGLVYFKAVAIPNAKSASFTVLHDSGYAKDSAKVFCKNAEIAGADVSSFDLPFKGIINFARDKENFYSGCNKLKAYDSASFSVATSPYINAEGWKGLFQMSGKLYFISGSSTSQIRNVEIIEVPFAPQAGSPLKIVGETSIEATSSDPAPYANGRRLITDGSHFAVFKYNPAGSGNQFVLLKNSLQIHLPSFAALDKPVYVDQDKVYVLDQAQGLLDVLPNVQPANFKAIGSGIYQTDSDLFSISSTGTWKKISEVDTLTFAAIGDGFFKDKNKVYFLKTENVEVVPGANPATMTRVTNNLYKDSSQVWYANLGSFLNIAGADAPSLKLLDDSSYWIVFYDQNKIYLASANIIDRTLQSTSVPVTNTTELKRFGLLYYYTSRVLYFRTDKEIKMVSGVTPGVLKSYGSCLGSDHSMICNGEVVPGIIADELIPVGDKYGSAEYFKSSTSVYHYSSFSSPLADAQLSTFRLADPNLSNFYATDGVRVWAGGKLLTMADAATFKVISLLSAEDKAYRYSISNATPLVKTVEIIPPPKVITTAPK